MDHLTLETTLNASCSKIFNDWLNAESHEAFTGGEVEISAKEGTSYTAWDGYISGEILELTENQTIKMTWRTSEFDGSEEDSIVTLNFKKISDNKSLMTLSQTNMPSGTKQKYTDGWHEFYFEPMQNFYGS
jgi:activator of HSP90 ATPase